MKSDSTDDLALKAAGVGVIIGLLLASFLDKIGSVVGQALALWSHHV